MKIEKLFSEKKRILSFELFAPKKEEDTGLLFQTAEELKKLNPDYISVTYGAGGTSRNLTYEIAVQLKLMGILPLMHFTCVGQSRGEIRAALSKVKEAGIENLLALRGDPPQGTASFIPPADGFRYANELVEFIRSENYDFCIGVAGYPEGHPESKSRDEDLKNLKRKVDSGGRFIVTQLFFDNRDYFQFVKNVQGMGVSLPVQPGMWLLTDYSQIKKICTLCGSKIPDELIEKLEPVKLDKEAVAQIGIEQATRQCEDLLKNGAPGIHFYVLNKSRFVQRVLENLREKGWIF